MLVSANVASSLQHRRFGKLTSFSLHHQDYISKEYRADFNSISSSHSCSQRMNPLDFKPTSAQTLHFNPEQWESVVLSKIKLFLSVMNDLFLFYKINKSTTSNNISSVYNGNPVLTDTCGSNRTSGSFGFIPNPFLLHLLTMWKLHICFQLDLTAVIVWQLCVNTTWGLSLRSRTSLTRGTTGSSSDQTWNCRSNWQLTSAESSGVYLHIRSMLNQRLYVKMKLSETTPILTLFDVFMGQHVGV